MSIPGYDAWKLASPDEDRGGTLCPICGAYSKRSCEMRDEMDGICPWEESEPDPDALMEQRREDRELEVDMMRDPRNWGDD